MPKKEFVHVMHLIEDFLTDHDIAHKAVEINIEREWVDFCLTIEDTKQIDRLNNWFLPDLRTLLVTYPDVDFACPIPTPEKQHWFRVRIYCKN